MTGASYGGGIQLVAAAIDRRVDAIVPDIAWNSLRTSLYLNATAKTGWSNLLLRLMAEGGSGPAALPVAATALSPVVGTRAANAVDVAISGRLGGRVLGAPRLSLTYRGRAPRPRARILAQLVDEATGTVLSNIVTPVPLHLDGRRRTVSLPLEVVTAAAPSTARFTLQLTAQSSQYDVRPAGGSVDFSRIRIALPTVRGS